MTGTLNDIVGRVAVAGLEPPALFVVGDVVALRDRLRRFPAPWARRLEVAAGEAPPRAVTAP